MFSFRPTADQWARLKAGRAPVSLVIESAVFRWRRGDFVLQKRGKKEKRTIVTRNIVLRADYKDVRDGEHMRRILDSHLNTPNARLEKELERARNEAEEIMRAHCSEQFILEEENGK